MKVFKTILKIIGIVIGAIVLIALCFLAYLSITEYKPKDVEEIVIEGEAKGNSVELGKEFNIVSWNIGYGKLGASADFVMDGGGNAPEATESETKNNLQGIKKVLEEQNADIWMIQELDRGCSRSYKIDEAEYLTINQGAFALNYKCDLVPFPWPPFGYVRSGIYTTSTYDISQAHRHSLPCTFSWPLRTANLKRCMQASYMPIKDSDKQLVIVNMHLEAYDDGPGREAQLKQVCDFLNKEFEKGNYVIAGGDFNQIMPGTTKVYPNTHIENWDVKEVPESVLPEGFKYIFDSSVPSCRLLNQPYNPADTVGTQYYVIDGFLVSPNVKVTSVNNLDLEFEYSDHNPVKLVLTLVK